MALKENPKKRKQKSDNAPPAKRPRFPAKPHNFISTTPTTTAYPNGELDTSRFIKTFEKEIKSLESAVIAAKKGKARRAFQDVPRDMRRRTGSHNPQRVPKRLRARARKEAKEDNTPISKNKSGSGIGKGSKNWLRKEGVEKAQKARERREKRRAKLENEVTVIADSTSAISIRKKSQKDCETMRKKRKKGAILAKPPLPAARFRRRQVHKTWLPTHVWHAKRALMTPPKEPLWRFAIPLAPVVKAYRLTHRAVTHRGAVAWDTSYLATISLEGTEASISGLLKALHFAQEGEEDPWEIGRRGKKWRDGTRTWEGWLYERESKTPKMIAKATIIWCSQGENLCSKNKVFVRVHPSAFLQLWNEVAKVAKVQKPTVNIEDLRFEIGSIEVMGPAAAETLSSILRPSPSEAHSTESPSSLWPSLSTITDPGQLPLNALLAFSICDPRLRNPPESSPLNYNNDFQTNLTDTLAYWPVDATRIPPDIFNRNSRLAAGRSLPSQKSINRRKSAATPGEYPSPRPTDPHIPMLTYVSRKSKSWTVLLPWKCVLPVWRCIMRYPVSTGGNPRFGGVKERRQVDFERAEPQFPFDYPATNAGWIWELQERAERKSDWTRRPKGKRVEWTAVDLGNGKKGEIGDPWACHWERLVSKPADDRQGVGKESAPEPPTTPAFYQTPTKDAAKSLAGHSLSADYLTVPHLFAVKITMVQRGVPTDCARIYRLPSNNPELRSKWLSLVPTPKPTAQKNTSGRRLDPPPRLKDLSKDARIQAVASGLLEPAQAKKVHLQASDPDYPRVPDEDDLIGFVTTGNYNLAEGRPTAVANLYLQRVLDSLNAGIDSTIGKRGRLCIVREAGQSLGRLATWEVA